MAHRSKGYTAADCSPIDQRDNPDSLAEIMCTGNHKEGGPGATGYYLFPNTAALDAAFTNESTQGLTVQPFPDGTTGPKPWSDGANHGSVVMGTSRRNLVYLTWSNDATLILANSNTMGDAASLYDWWQANR